MHEIMHIFLQFHITAVNVNKDCFLKVCCFLRKKMGEEVLSRRNTLLWECEKDETPQERMRLGGSTLAHGKPSVFRLRI